MLFSIKGIPQIEFYWVILFYVVFYMIYLRYFDKWKNWVKLNSAPYLRLFAPFYRGNHEYSKNAFSFLLSNIQKDS